MAIEHSPIESGATVLAFLTPAARERTAGAKAFLQLAEQVHEVSDNTCLSLGEDVDGRDYFAMARLVEAVINTTYVRGTAGQREGFVRALADMLCWVGDGCFVQFDERDPLSVTEAAFRRSQARSRGN